MKTRTAVVLGVVALAGLGITVAAAAGSAGASGPVRHGIRMIGACEDFNLEDGNAFAAWAIPEIEQLLYKEDVRDAEEVVTLLYGALFPECEWPPKEGTKARATWDDVMARLAPDVQQLLDQLLAEEGVSKAVSPQIFARIAARVGGLYL